MTYAIERVYGSQPPVHRPIKGSPFRTLATALDNFKAERSRLDVGDGVILIQVVEGGSRELARSIRN